MEITMDMLNNLSAEDLENIVIYRNLLTDAKSDVAAIVSAYKFKIGEEVITIWDDSNNAEYLTHSGFWKARYLHQSYDVKIDAESVFDVYKEEYLNKKSKSITRNVKAESASYFKSFADRARSVLTL